jgi:hypothetical protein
MREPEKPEGTKKNTLECSLEIDNEITQRIQRFMSRESNPGPHEYGRVYHNAMSPFFIRDNSGYEPGNRDCSFVDL